ncbi:urea transporter [Dasania sp. GY-MA-18]|uniref:Urea transporter n=1 Tax=Dasania phycosphaerae TaxID=2950436 RepID=A0A9J6RQ44_9GAMM|nr:MULTISPECIES: urea transporter [Dasania]MCR8923854.1 urea transporter [Dasania sp. GY-MA-18]MCZ0866288.1 urea transporter [Dasania phycosphaerae]MCZ0870012.1 urea transporter [Dasania phycosphaerae]
MIKTAYLTQAINIFLTGFGQIMLQENRLTGLFFLAGILVNSVTQFLTAVSASLIALLTAYSCGFSRQHIAKGWYGFNGALVGLAVASFFPLSWLAVILLLAGSILSSLLMRLMLTSKALPPYTSPFVLTIWLLLIGAHFFAAPLVEARAKASELVVYEAIFRGLAQVMFQDHVLTGVLFALGIVCSSRLLAVWGLLAAMLGVMLAMLLGLSEQLTGAGVYGYNAVLAAIALAGNYKKSVVLPLLGAVIAFAITLLFQTMAAPALTAPFILAVWLVLTGKNIVDRFFHLPTVV